MNLDFFYYLLITIFNTKDSVRSNKRRNGWDFWCKQGKRVFNKYEPYTY